MYRCVLLTDAERLRVYRGPERVADADRQIDANVARMPALTPRRRDAVWILMRSQPASR
jgi:hypothetical protein